MAVDVEAEAFLAETFRQSDRGMILDDELHPGPFDGHTDHESEQNNATFIQDAQLQHVEEDPGDDFEMIDIDGNTLSR